jgi:hypothetical protein
MIGGVLLVVALATSHPAQFWFKAPLLETTSAEYLALGDLDGDGDVDLVTLVGGACRILLNRGDGQFVPGAAVPASVSFTDPRLTDLDGDGRFDLAFGADAALGVLPGLPGAQFAPLVTVP